MARRMASGKQVMSAKAGLSASRAIPAAKWPGALTRLDMPGVYAWFVDRRGASELAAGYGQTLRTGRLYVGEAGVDTLASLRERVECHLCRCKSPRSTLRRTLACGLLRERKWRVSAPRSLEPNADSELTVWMRRHLRVAVHPFSDRAVLRSLEPEVIRQLRPPFNLRHPKSQDTPLQARIRVLRKQYDLQ
jgi:hypothetical protein